MKKIYLSLVLCFVCLMANAQIPNYVPANGLVAWYPFNGNANDESGNGNNGVVTGATLTNDRNNVANKAYYFNGSSYIDCGTSSQMAMTNSLTLNCWGKTTNQYSNHCIAGRWSNVTNPMPYGTPEYCIFFNNNQVVSCIVITTPPNQYVPGNFNYYNGQWHMYTMTYDGYTNKIYVDGVLIGSMNVNGNIQTYSNKFIIGTYTLASFPNNLLNSWQGEIDDVGLWNRALTQCEIKSLYNAVNIFSQDTLSVCGTNTTLTAPSNFTYIWNTLDTSQSINVTQTGWYKCTISNAGCTQTDSVFVSLVNAQIQQNDTTICSGASLTLSVAGTANIGQTPCSSSLLPANLQNGLVGYWPFCGNANDESGNGNNGTVYNANLSPDRFGNATNAYSFNNSLIKTINYNQATPNSFSYSFWVNPSITHTLPFEGQTINGGNFLTSQCVLHATHGACYGNPTQNAGAGVYVGTNGLYIIEHSDNFVKASLVSSVSIQGWHLVTVLYNNKVPSLFVDGNFIKQGVSDSRNVFPSFGIDNTIYADYSMSGFGSGFNGVSNQGQKFLGSIDDFMIYNRVLSPSEITQLYNLTSPINNSYLWSTGDTTTTININPTQSTSYWVQVSNGITTCTDTIHVTVNNFSNLIAQDTISACGNSVTINATPGLPSYSWSGGGNTASKTVTATGWYSLTASNGTCTATDSVFVSLVNAQIQQNDTTICSGASLTLSVAGTANIGQTPCSSSLLPANLQNGLVGYWPFCGNANDESGNGNNGIVNGAQLTNDRFNTSSNAYEFSYNGNNCNNIIIPNSPSLNPSQMTINCWINAQDSNLNILEKSDPNNATKLGYSLTFKDEFQGWKGLKTCYGYGNCNTTSNPVFWSQPNLYPLYSWVMVTVVIKQNGDIEQYLNSNLVYTVQGGQNLNPCNDPIATLRIGGPHWYNDPECFKGKIDDLSIWNRVLTLSEITQLYNSTSNLNNSYLWSTGDTTTTINVNPIQSTNYWVQVSNGITTCTDTIHVTVNQPVLSINASPNDTVCTGQTLILSGQGASTYSWSGGVNNGVGFIPASSATYTVTGTDALGCSATKSISIVVQSAPTVSANANPTSICLGNTSTLSATGGSSYTWQPGNLTGSPVVSPNTTTTYTVTAVNANGCSNTATRTVVVNPLPTVSTTANPSAICIGESSVLNATGGTSYTWQPGGLTGSPNVSPTSTITYTVTAVNANGCSNTATQIVVVNQLPIVSTSANPSSICIGASSVLSATGGISYTWQPGGLTGSPSVSPTTTTTYTVTAVNANGCSNTSTQTIVVNTLPTVSVSGNPTAICVGASSVLSATGGTAYIWQPGNLTGSPSVSPNTTTIYTVTASNANGCSNTGTVTIDVINGPSISVSASPASICLGGSTTLSALGGQNYIWQPGSLGGSPTVSPTVTTTYTVTASNAQGCTNVGTLTVTVNNIPAISATANPNNVCAGSSTQLSASGGISYQWQPGNLVGAPVVNPTVATTYTVVGTDNNGCSNSNTVSIQVNALPNVAATINPNVICAGGGATLQGTGATSYYWMPGNIFGAPMVFPNVTTTYTVTGTAANGCTATSSATLTVDPPPVITQNPANQTSVNGGTAQFTVQCNNPNATYIWQRDNGLGFQNLSNGGQYSGVNTNTLTISNLTQANNGNWFRCQVSLPGCNVISTQAILKVDFALGLDQQNSNPSIHIYPNPANNTLYIHSAPEAIGSQLLIRDLSGRVCYAQTLENENTTIPVAAWARGLYMLNVISNKGNWVYRVVLSD